MIFPIVLAGATDADIASSADTVPMHFEEAAGIQSRYQTVLSAVAAPEFHAPTVLSSDSFAAVARTPVGGRRPLGPVAAGTRRHQNCRRGDRGAAQPARTG